MNVFVIRYPSAPESSGNPLFGSSLEWDYDYQNLPELRGTDFWSDSGGTGIFWKRYEVGAAAMRKINIESPGFYKKFNTEYYNRINSNPNTVTSTRELMVSIISTIVPKIEGKPAATWIDEQHVFWARNIYGLKILHSIQDYQWDEFFAFHSMYFTRTMNCGSEWACWDGTKWVFHNLNGANGKLSVFSLDYCISFNHI